MLFYQKNISITIICFFSFIFINENTFSTSKIDGTKLKIITLSEFIKHNNENSCWVLMGKYIYDVTLYLKKHPAPYKILRKCCAKDCTQGYLDKGISVSHSKGSDKIRDKMLLGILKEKM